MSNLCDNCKKNKYALVITKNVNGEKSNTHLCYQCSLEMQTPLFLKSLFATILQVEKHASSYNQGPACSNCQSTLDDLLKRGKVGCAICYETFSTELHAIMDSIQWSLTHKGKIPKHNGKKLIAKKEISDLRRQLEKAISREEFEEAARLRDEIKALTGDKPKKELNFLPIDASMEEVIESLGELMVDITLQQTLAKLEAKHPLTPAEPPKADPDQFTLDTLFDQNQIDITEHLAATEAPKAKPKAKKPAAKKTPPSTQEEIPEKKPKAKPKSKPNTDDTPEQP